MTPLHLTFAQVATILDAEPGQLRVLVNAGRVAASGPPEMTAWIARRYKGTVPARQIDHSRLTFDPEEVRRFIYSIGRPSAMHKQFYRIAYKEVSHEGR